MKIFRNSRQTYNVTSQERKNEKTDKQNNK